MLVQGHTSPAVKGQDGTGLFGVPKGWQEWSHSSFSPSPKGWSLKMDHIEGGFERRLQYGH